MNRVYVFERKHQLSHLQTRRRVNGRDETTHYRDHVGFRLQRQVRGLIPSAACSFELALSYQRAH
jgi:hypothetical protein